MNIELAQNEDFTFTTKGGHTVTVPDADGTLALQGGSVYQSKIVSPDGNTDVNAVNGGTATIKVENARTFVAFADGYSVSGTVDSTTYTYTAPSGGETIEFFGPITSSLYPGLTFWVPEAYKNSTNFDPTAQSVWCLTQTLSDTIRDKPTVLLYAIGPEYRINEATWESTSQEIAFVEGSGTASGTMPVMTRSFTTTTKTVATTDQIPTVNDAVLTIQKDGVTIATFSANASQSTTANITIPTSALDRIVATNGKVKVIADTDGFAKTQTEVPGYGDAYASFYPGFSISYGGETYTAPTTGEEVHFVGPFEISGGYYWVPDDIPNPESFDPSQNSVWCLYSTLAGAPSIMMFGTGPYYTITTWESSTPTLTLDMGTATGDGPSMMRNPAPPVTRVIATTDKIIAALVEKTWAELKAMRNGGTLVPGQQYRITDYVATTAQADTQSANKPFDIIVTADSTNKLNEVARAIKNASATTYFTGKLEAWKVWYCIDNDTARFAWADTTNGKGVVYRLIDEFGNDCPYDFKGIKFKRWAISYITGGTALDSTGKTALENLIKYSETGVCYSTKSSNINFGGLISGDYVSCVVDSSTSAFYFTFDSSGNDASISASSNVHDNTMKPYFTTGGLQGLNSIVMLGTGVYGNMFSEGCHDMIMGTGCYRNLLGGGCDTFILARNCYNNSFGSNCTKILAGNNMWCNTIGTESDSNVFVNDCYRNSFGEHCYCNTFQGCVYNSSDVGLNNCRLFYGCSHNKFGNSDRNIHLGRSCYNNTFGNNVDGVWFGEQCQSNSIGDGCSYIVFGNDQNSPLGFYSWNIVETGVFMVKLYCDQTLGSNSVYRHVTVTQGVNTNQESWKTITDSNVSQLFRTVYQRDDSQVVSV